MAKVISTWFYEAAIDVQETIEDDTVEKATQKAHQQLKPGENDKYKRLFYKKQDEQSRITLKIADLKSKQENIFT